MILVKFTEWSDSRSFCISFNSYLGTFERLIGSNGPVFQVSATCKGQRNDSLNGLFLKKSL